MTHKSRVNEIESTTNFKSLFKNQDIEFSQDKSRLKLPTFDKKYANSFATSPVATTDTERLQLYRQSMNLRRSLEKDDSMTQLSQVVLPSISHIN